ncbi:hypothetical protein ACFV6F_17505 [Kitasatospora phosalacinea]|uniref:hypothetical protein n=1 Tax=Kitasatospora phosalacinea TaxID=2065 RepID=UPI00365CE989
MLHRAARVAAVAQRRPVLADSRCSTAEQPGTARRIGEAGCSRTPLLHPQSAKVLHADPILADHELSADL